ncbi:MAG: hypothetical protein NTV79_03975 [Candidatus Aureabacteria bacterium]|nr:hypothetical protein [Candidatus Auribacterota bacterium]
MPPRGALTPGQACPAILSADLSADLSAVVLILPKDEGGSPELAERRRRKREARRRGDRAYNLDSAGKIA